MPSSPCDKFVYEFSAYVFTLSTGIVRFLLRPPPQGNRTEPVRGSAFARCPCGDCAMLHTTCLRATGLQLFFFKFVKLLAKPNRRGRGARESVPKSHSRLLPPQGGLAEAARKGGYGQDTGSVDPSQAKCELGIMPSSHLPRTPCDKFFCDFPCDFS